MADTGAASARTILGATRLGRRRSGCNSKPSSVVKLVRASLTSRPRWASMSQPWVNSSGNGECDRQLENTVIHLRRINGSVGLVKMPRLHIRARIYRSRIALKLLDAHRRQWLDSYATIDNDQATLAESSVSCHDRGGMGRLLHGHCSWTRLRLRGVWPLTPISRRTAEWL